MTSTPIAQMVLEMIKRGVDPDVIALAVSTAETVVSGGQERTSVDTSADRRRAWDRDRKRLQRGLRLSDSEWLPLVAQILKRDGHACTYCGAKEKLTADHVVPLTRGGTNDPSNLTACCLPCNTKKGNKLVAEWLPATSTVFHPNVRTNPPDEQNASTSVRNITEENKKKRETARGTRLPDNWAPTAIDHAIALEMLGPDRAKSELEKYRDHWKQQPGSKGVKLDWDAAWRNWIRRSAEYRGGTNGNRNSNAGNRPAGGTFLDGLRSLAEDIAGDAAAPGPAAAEIPRGRFEIDG